VEPTYDVLTVGDVCVDLVLTGDVVPRFGQTEQLIDDYALELGGSSVIFASQFAKLGGRVGLLGAVGDDPFGRFAYERMRSVGIEMSRVRVDGSVKTGLSVALAKSDGDRSILTLLGSIDAVQPVELTDDLLRQCRHWHLGSLFLLESLRSVWKEWLLRCRRAGVTVSLDTNWDPTNRWEGVLDLLDGVDVFLPNENEAMAMTGASSAEEAGRFLAARCPCVVVKRGAEGVCAFFDGSEVRVPAEPVERIADTVGAGDNFDAGFVRGWLLGWELEACLRLGNACAGASLRAGGGIEGQLRWNLRDGEKR